MAQPSSVEHLTRKPHIESELQHKTKEIVRQVPPTVFLKLALGSMAISAALAIFARHKETANFVGLWAPSFLLIGIYNKLTHLEEKEESQSDQRVA